MDKVPHFSVSSFSLLAFMPLRVQRKRTKRKGSRSLAASLLIPQAGHPCAARKKWTLRKVASLRRIVFPLFAALLGSVKWQ